MLPKVDAPLYFIFRFCRCGDLPRLYLARSSSCIPWSPCFVRSLELDTSSLSVPVPGCSALHALTHVPDARVFTSTLPNRLYCHLLVSDCGRRSQFFTATESPRNRPRYQLSVRLVSIDSGQLNAE
jgi:hypothetical protein